MVVETMCGPTPLIFNPFNPTPLIDPFNRDGARAQKLVVHRGGRGRMAKRGGLLDHPELQGPRRRAVRLSQGRPHAPARDDQPPDPQRHAQSLGRCAQRSSPPRFVDVVNVVDRTLRPFQPRQGGLGVTLTDKMCDFMCTCPCRWRRPWASRAARTWSGNC